MVTSLLWSASGVSSWVLILFLLYINDLHDVVSHSELNVFVDDAALFKEIYSSSDCDFLLE